MFCKVGDCSWRAQTSPMCAARRGVRRFEIRSTIPRRRGAICCGSEDPGRLETRLLSKVVGQVGLCVSQDLDDGRSVGGGEALVFLIRVSPR
jgi:hypothetical protein